MPYYYGTLRDNDVGKYSIGYYSRLFIIREGFLFISMKTPQKANPKFLESRKLQT